jgi:phospholipid-binding lipoprotein MlaA
MLVASPPPSAAVQQAVPSTQPPGQTAPVVPDPEPPAPVPAEPVPPAVPPVEQTAPVAAQPVLPVDPTQADVVVKARDNRDDPMSAVNVEVFKVTEDIDKAVIGPAARAYEKRVPGPFRSGLRNFLNNLREPIVFANFLLQLKVGKAAETFGRFALNSTVGVAGVMDIAKRKPFRLPLRRNGFANTMGFYGIGPGPFFFLPLIGPTSLRDLFGTVVDQVVIPIQPIRPSNSLTYLVPVGALSALDYRLRIEPDLQRQRATDDSYAALRAEFTARRQAEIDRLRGKLKGVPLPKADDPPSASFRAPTPPAEVPSPPAPDAPK